MADEPQEGRIILYQEDGRNVPVEVTYWRETFWLTQQKMAELFNVTVPTINEHLKNIFSSGELTETSTIRKSRIVRQEGSRQVSREISFYNLDAIIAVGYRVNSRQATQFRQWATGILREYIVKGFALNDDMLKKRQTVRRRLFRGTARPHPRHPHQRASVLAEGHRPVQRGQLRL